MAGLTDHYNLPYPQGTDDAAIASDIQALAVSVDSAVYTSEQLLMAADSGIIEQVNALKTNVRYTLDSVVAEAGDFIVCDSPSIITVTLPSLPQEDDIVRIYRNGNGAVSIVAAGVINGPVLITSKNTGIIATFTNSQWWCLPLSFSDSGSGYTPAPAWDRPSEWMNLPITIDSNTNGTYFLVHIPQGITDIIGIYLDCNAGAGKEFYIDWGDGTSEIFLTTGTGTTRYHTYQWSTMSPITEMLDGTRQAYILLEPTSINNQINGAYPVNSVNTNLRKYVKEMVSASKYADFIYCAPSIENLIVYCRGISTLDMSYCADDEHDLRKAVIYYESGGIDLDRAFYYVPKLESVYIFGTLNNNSQYSMTEGCYSLKNVYMDSTIRPADVSYMMEDAGITQPIGFNITGKNPLNTWGIYYTSSLKNVNGEDSVTYSQYADGFYAYCYALESAKNLDFRGNLSVEDMFSDCYNLKEVSNLDVSGTQYCDDLFRNCYTLKNVNNLNINSSATGSARMFNACYALEKIENSTINLSNVISASSMFNSCYSLKEIPNLVSTNNLTNASSMFYYCQSITSLPALNFSNVTSASNLAGYCSRLEWSDIYGLKVSHSYINCNLSAAALDNIYNNLGTVPPASLKAISSANASNTVTYYNTAAPHGFSTGQYVSVSGFSQSQFNFTNYYVYVSNSTQFYVYNYPYNYTVASGTLGNAYLEGSVATITVTGNLGVSGDNPAIATSKGWTVTG